MGRGRRPNLALEPTRALQTQRAFRQRKAQHLATLEHSVQLLEDENSHLRKLLNLAPRSPAATRVKQSSSPLDSSVAAVKAEEQEEERCASCARLRQENRRLQHAAAQWEARTLELAQTVKALQGVLANHGIPVPASMDGTMVEHRSKRMRSDPSETNGVHMTEQYFIPADHQSVAGPSRRNGGSSWHNTPSPSVLASTPPAAAAPAGGFSPRYSIHSPSAIDEYYRRSIPPPLPSAGTNGARHNGSGGGSRLPSHPMSPAPAARQHWSTGNSSASDSPAAMSRSHHPPPAHTNGWTHSPPVHIPAQPDQHTRSVMGARRLGEEYSSPGQSYDFAAAASPRMRIGGSPRERDSPRNGSYPAPSPAQAASKVQPCRPTASQGETKCCPPTNSGKSCIPQPKPPTPPETIDHRAASESWSGPPPLGVSFDMRTSTTTTAADATPAAAVAASTEQVKLDGLKEDECCFGLVKCDPEGRIII
ncbi:hypothetical protein PHSY_000878 [Pseudozyma hubeiensis SY62]|uniref:BZIP domain-containing protein n=1 Tax=Pseudozyma hubeiensis (strain SY62) TaxID=1305764 RepID=R9NXC3_PSEHS|nr:hypothetical protein PHSY_000878 [Pseudozyma hubeiensis SY62]GAC93313.1 hypothetical protein PHSY_000878 [Pseudozyma hubeiensis SY62]